MMVSRLTDDVLREQNVGKTTLVTYINLKKALLVLLVISDACANSTWSVLIKRYEGATSDIRKECITCRIVLS